MDGDRTGKRGGPVRDIFGTCAEAAGTKMCPSLPLQRSRRRVGPKPVRECGCSPVSTHFDFRPPLPFLMPFSLSPRFWQVRRFAVMLLASLGTALFGQLNQPSAVDGFDP